MRRALMTMSVLALMMAVGIPASAGRDRFSTNGPKLASTDGSPGPSAPEPSAALAFAAGVGVIGWALRKRSR